LEAEQPFFNGDRSRIGIAMRLWSAAAPLLRR
jgi:hypothetical protein